MPSLMQWSTAGLLGLGFCLALPGARAAEPAWVATGGQVSYRLVHKFHEVEGISKQVELSAVLDPQQLKVMVRVPVRTFDSQNANRDAHALEVVEAAKFPYVILRAVGPGFAPLAPGEKKRLQVQAEVELHGVKTRQAIWIELEARESRRGQVRFSFDESLAAHGIVAPSLLFVPVNDALKIEGCLAVEQGGVGLLKGDVT